MTRDKAIKILTYFPINIGRGNGKHLIQEAMNMAIEALENNDKLAEDLQNCLEMYKKKKAEVKALKRKRGEWVYLYEDNYKCSVCGSWWCCTDSQIDEMNYCPNCGADMRGEENDKG